MADIIDQANDLAELQLQANLAKHTHAVAIKPSAFYCVECDEVIPHQRRNAITGVQTCIECQEALELKKKGGR